MSAARDGRAGRIAELERALVAREGRPGYKRNAQAIRAKLALLKALSEQETSHA